MKKQNKKETKKKNPVSYYVTTGKKVNGKVVTAETMDLKFFMEKLYLTPEVNRKDLTLGLRLKILFRPTWYTNSVKNAFAELKKDQEMMILILSEVAEFMGKMKKKEKTAKRK